MNSNSAVATTAAAVTGTMLGGVIIWLCGIWHLEPPPSDVAGTIGALILGVGHAVVNWFSARFPARAAAPAAPITPASIFEGQH